MLREVVWWQGVEIVKETISSLYLDLKEVVMVAQAGETTKKTTSSLHLDMREVVVLQWWQRH